LTTCKRWTTYGGAINKLARKELIIEVVAMSRILKSAHKSAKRMHDAGYMDDLTMREFDALCLTPCPDPTPTESGDAETINLSPEDQRAFVDAILNPPEPTAGLRRAFERHGELIKPSQKS
jgi:hypothetical protein